MNNVVQLSQTIIDAEQRGYIAGHEDGYKERSRELGDNLAVPLIFFVCGAVLGALATWASLG